MHMRRVKFVCMCELAHNLRMSETYRRYQRFIDLTPFVGIDPLQPLRGICYERTQGASEQTRKKGNAVVIITA